MTTVAYRITSLTVVYSIVYSGADQWKHQSSASLAFVWGIHRDRWFPRTKGRLREKCFHLMTSSWKHSAITGGFQKANAKRWDVLLLLAWISCWTNCQVVYDFERWTLMCRCNMYDIISSDSNHTTVVDYRPTSYWNHVTISTTGPRSTVPGAHALGVGEPRTTRKAREMAGEQTLSGM